MFIYLALSHYWFHSALHGTKVDKICWIIKSLGASYRGVYSVGTKIWSEGEEKRGKIRRAKHVHDIGSRQKGGVEGTPLEPRTENATI